MVTRVNLKNDQHVETMEDVIKEVHKKYKSFIRQPFYLRINESGDSEIEFKDAIDRKSLKDGKSGYLIFRLENKDREATGSERA